MGNQEEKQKESILSQSRYLRRFERLMKGIVPEGKLVGPEFPMELTGDIILIERLDKKEKTVKCGELELVVAEATTYKETFYDQAAEVGIVLAVGPGQHLDDGTVIPCMTKPGDVVLLSGHIDWYSEFMGMKNYKAGTIGRARDSNLCLFFTNYDKAMELLNE